MEEERGENGRWGTWEELLLACAVNRHGTKRWDSVAMEIQSRSSSARVLTAQICRQKYHDLQRRFITGNEKSEGEERDEIPWLEELRRLRVSELKREVQRYDVSIASLQLKVNKLKQEREQGLKENEIAEEKTDLLINGEENEKVGEAGKSSPGDVTGTHISGDESDRETESFNESNSMDPRDGNREIEEKKPEELETEVETGAGKPGPVSGDPTEEKVVEEVELARKISGELAEFRESVAESKESSDVQSSASLLKKKRRKRTIPGNVSGEEPEIDEVCPASSVKSQPLIGLLEMIRSHKYGYIFERRLQSQESEEYGRLIREHVDLEKVKSKVEEGLYDSAATEFFRDLLLLFNNAIVFYPKNSTESDAAIEIRELISKDISTAIHKPPDPPPSEDPKPVPEPSTSAPVIFCRRRTSVSAKPSKSRETDAKADLEVDNVNNNNPVRSVNQDRRIEKKKRKERSVSGLRSNDNRSKGKNPNPSRNRSKESNSESNKIGSSSNSKKGSVANFLNRMKRSSNGAVLSEANSGSRKGEVAGKQTPEQKKGGRDGLKEHGTHHGNAGKQAAPVEQRSTHHGNAGKQAAPVEQRSTPTKRSIGRPPKKVPPMLKEAVPVLRPPRKRSRR